MILNTTQKEQLPGIVQCHKEAFPDSLSTKQGSKFISKMMEWYVVSDRGVLFHVEDESGEIVGYCGGIITKQPGLLGAVSSISQYAFNQFIVSYLTRPWLFFHPENLKKLPYAIRNIAIRLGLKSKVQRVSTAQAEEFEPFMGLVVIGVSHKGMGKGYGSVLLQEFERRAKKEDGIQKIQLSVKSENARALKAYFKNGWTVSQDHGATQQLIKYI